MYIEYETLIKVSTDQIKRMLVRFLPRVRVSKLRSTNRKIHCYKENWQNFQSPPKVKMIPFSAPLTDKKWTNAQFREFLRAAARAEAGVSRYSNTHYGYVPNNEDNDCDNILKSLKQSL